MADQLSISLRAWPQQDKTKESLPYLIARINDQKGSFRNVTEASLEEEIRAAEAGEASKVETAEDKELIEDGQDAKMKGDELSKAREEIIKQISAAHTASSHALDFVSLLLSKHAPKAAEATISPFVKHTVPMGSIGAEIMQEPNRSEAEKTTEEMVGLGWRMQSLTRSADSLLRSASRLEQEIGRETTHWQQVLAVKETHAEFRDRGLAALRRNQDGSIRLDRGPRWQGDKKLRVRLLQKGKLLGTNEQSTVPNDDDLPLPQLLVRARNSLFDEELYHEMNRESRNLMNQEVCCIGDAIRFPFNNDSHVEVDLVAIDEEQGALQDGDSFISETIAMTLRILLSYAHRENLNRRSQPPAPIAETSPPQRFCSLLRPIPEILQHDSAVKATRTLLTRLKRALTAANLPFSTEELSSSLDFSEISPTAQKTQISTIDTLLNHLVRPHTSHITLHLPSNHITFKLSINTSIFPPTFGTSFILSTVSSSTSSDSAIAKMPQMLQFPTVDKLQKHLFHVVALDITSVLLATPDFGAAWIMVSPYQAELVRKGKRRDKIAVGVGGEGVRVEWSGDGKETASYVWLEPAEEVGGKGLMDVVREFVL
ncbi:MAG: hypothetical protein Q9225_005027 [Loekoesia sp. 1 TL-2023]